MTPTRLMRKLLPSRLSFLHRSTNAPLNIVTKVSTTPAQRCDPSACINIKDCRCFAQVIDSNNDRLNRSVYFNSTIPNFTPPGLPQEHKPPDERTLQLGKTVRTLHERLPTLLQSPLPAEILAPNISLHLFPSTHPHLPTVSGRMAYSAALWTAPVAWGRVPLVGNVKLTILSERMVGGRAGSGSGGSVNLGGVGGPGGGEERLIVKWKTCGKTRHRDGTGGVYSDRNTGSGMGTKDPVDKIKEFVASARSAKTTSTSTSTSNNPNKEVQQEESFTGLFLFEFDSLGRVRKHVIEHTEEGGNWDSMTRVVSVTDWLLGQWKGGKREREAELAWCEERPSGGRIQCVDRRGRV